MLHGFELFSDIFVLRDNVLLRLDARVKLIAVLGICTTVILSTRVYLPLAMLALCVAAMLALGLPLRLIAVRLAMPLAMAGVLIVLRAFLMGTTPLFTLRLFGWNLTAMREGLMDGAVLASRVLGSVSALILFSVVTPAHKVFAALRWFRLPKTWVETAMLMYRYIFALLDHTTDVFAAQRARLGYAGLRRSLSSMGTLAGAVLVHSMEQADRTHEAMVARGYTGDWPHARLGALQGRQVAILAACLALLTAACFVIERWA